MFKMVGVGGRGRFLQTSPILISKNKWNIEIQNWGFLKILGEFIFNFDLKLTIAILRTWCLWCVTCIKLHSSNEKNNDFSLELWKLMHQWFHYNRHPSSTVHPWFSMVQKIHKKYFICGLNFEFFLKASISFMG